MTELTEQEINELREKSGKDVQRILRELESNAPELAEGFGAITGAGIGGAASLAALYGLGTTGLSAAGITSGLAAGLGGGMVAGVGVLAAPVAILGIVGYSIFKHKKVKRQTAALQHALGQLYSVLERLTMNAKHFQQEIAGITAMINTLKSRAPA
ncbi:MAG: hypothetical protein PHN45_01410 [Methylococcales bacterium]|nr:hypothetical protein [Methylococcales bacterium]